jgi:hypothetical protein
MTTTWVRGSLRQRQGSPREASAEHQPSKQNNLWERQIAKEIARHIPASLERPVCGLEVSRHPLPLSVIPLWAAGIPDVISVLCDRRAQK